MKLEVVKSCLVSALARGDGYTRSVILSQKIQLIEFLAIFFLRLFQLSHHLCEGGYTFDFPRALAT